MSVYEGVRNLPSPRDADATIVGRVEGGEIVVRATWPNDPAGAVLFRYGWNHHLHRTEIHPSILELIAEATATAVRSARDRGHDMAMAELRTFIGVR